MVSPYVAHATGCDVVVPRKFITPRVQLNFLSIAAARNLRSVGWGKVSDFWNGNSVDYDVTILDLNSTFSHKLESQGVNAMLNLQYANCKCFFTIARSHRDRASCNDWSGIHFGHDKMHGRAMNCCTRLKDASVCVETLEIR